MKGLVESAATRGFQIPSLDGIRGLAALLVYLGHAGWSHLVPGGFGVTVFFFLSGYLITTLLRREHAATGGIRFGRFYLRRVYRILPPMYIVLVLAMLLGLSGALGHEMRWDAVLAQLAHLTNYWLVAAGPAHFVPETSAMWSLAVEEHFYLLYPLALVLLLRRFDRSRVAALLLVTCGIVLAWRCCLIMLLGQDADYTYHATDTRVDSLLFGCIMGLWLNPAMEAQRIELPGRVVVLVLTAAIGLLLVSFLWRSEVFRETLRYSLQGMALFALFFCAVRYHHWPVFSWLDSRPMRALGLISYTFYLAHLPILALLAQHTRLGGISRALVGLVATTAFSALMYLLIERRLGALRQKLHRDARAPASTSPAVLQPTS